MSGSGNLIGEKLTLNHAIWLAMTEQVGDSLIYIRKFAKSAVLVANTDGDVWSQGGALSYLTTSQTMSVVSTSTADAVGGTGGRQLYISGLDEDYNFQSEVVALNGTTPVITSKSFLRIYSARLIDAGSGERNAGKITMTATTAGTVQAAIEALRSVTEMSQFTIPNNYTAMAINLNMSVYRAAGGTGSRAAEIQIHARVPSPYDPTRYIDYETNKYGLRSDGASISSLSSQLKGSIPAKTDYRLTATAESNNTVCSVQYDLLLIKAGYMDNTTLI